MFFKNNKINKVKKENRKEKIKENIEEKIINQKLDKLNKILEKSNILELSYILGNKKEIFKRNLIAGISRGIGISIGVSLITAVLIFILRRIILLNIPIIGDYIADIVEIVEKSR